MLVSRRSGHRGDDPENVDPVHFARRILPWFDAALRGWVALPIVVRASVPLAVMALLWWSSSQEAPLQPHGLPRALLHNSMHVFAYAALGGSLLLAFVRAPLAMAPSRLALLGSFVLSCAYGIVDELHQAWVPGRVCSVADLASDALGCALALTMLTCRLRPGRRGLVALGLCAAGCVVSVALATFIPW